MGDQPELKLYNTLTRKKQAFTPIDADKVRMYVCGPTVYDYAHIGNARPVIVFDVLFRLLRHLYGAGHVAYVRNITDVDDKINARALRDFPDLPLNEAIRNVTEKTTRQFHADVKALGCLEPTHEPRATEHIKGMVKMIETLIDKGNAYQAGGEALFDVSSMPDYGQLSNRKIEDQKAGARVEAKSHKKNPGDFVLWKLSDDDEPGWPSPWGLGRPGWHIECSVMSEHHLGKTFDIHGGGLDLIFPHHENEIAQSRCAHGNEAMANVWMHNGFLQVEGRKMSKSEGNFVTIQDLIKEVWPGEVIRFNMLKTHYRQPLDWTEQELNLSFDQYYSLTETAAYYPNSTSPINLDLVAALSDDLNTPLAISVLFKLQKAAVDGDIKAGESLFVSIRFLGFSDFQLSGGSVIPKLATNETSDLGIEFGATPERIAEIMFDLFPRNFPLGRAIKILKNTNRVDMRKEVEAVTSLVSNVSTNIRLGEIVPIIDNIRKIDEAANKRLTHIANKDWPAADAIRDELLAQGIQLNDSKDSKTGERITTWEVKR